MICGALQTLNEEACEDVMEETEEETPYKTSSLDPSSELGESSIINLRRNSDFNDDGLDRIEKDEECI